MFSHPSIRRICGLLRGVGRHDRIPTRAVLALLVALGCAGLAGPAQAAGRSNSLVATVSSSSRSGTPSGGEQGSAGSGNAGGSSSSSGSATQPGGAPGSSTATVVSRGAVVVHSASSSSRSSGLTVHRSSSRTVPTPGRPGPGSPGSSSPSSGMTQQELLMLQLINEARSQSGVPPVQPNPTLMQIARLKGQDILENGYWGHVSPTYGSPSDMARAAGLTFWWVGENLAKGGSVQQAFEALMGSSTHRANILYPSHTQVGIAVLQYERWDQQRVLVVQEFLTPAPPTR